MVVALTLAFLLSVTEFRHILVLFAFSVRITFSDLLITVDDFSKGFLLLSGLVLFIRRIFFTDGLGVFVMLVVMIRFVVRSSFWFLLVFELVLVPVCLLILIGKGGERFVRSIFLLVYTLLFSVPFLLVCIKVFSLGG